MSTQSSTATTTDGQHEHMSQAIARHKANLEQLKGTTRSAKLIDTLNEGLLVSEQIQAELGGPGAPGLETRWADAIRAMQNAEEEVRRWRNTWGWQWFWAFTFLLLAGVALYIILHLRIRPTDPDIFLWTEGRKAYAEVAFWALFGLLTWTVYNLQHHVREGHDITLWSQWYLSKVLQGVPIAVIIVLAIKQIDLGTTVSDRIVPVIMGFILGYYSDRARDYLDRIRDRLFSDTSPPEIEISLPVDKSTATLPTTVLRGQVTRGEVAQAKVTVNGNPPKALAVDSNGNFSDLVQLSPGENLVRVDVETAAKRTGSASAIVYNPGPKPVVMVSSPQSGAKMTTPKATITGTIADAQGNPLVGATGVLLREGDPPIPFKVNVRGDFSQEVQLKEGDNVIRVAVAHGDLWESAAVTIKFEKPPEGVASSAAGDVVSQPEGAS